MRLPHERYIRFLITSGLDLEDTNEHLLEKGLPPCPVDGEGNSEYWDSQYEKLHSAKIPKSIKNFWNKEEKKKFPQGFFEYMNVVGLQDAWKYNVGQNKLLAVAVDALEDEDVSISTRALLTLKSPPEEVAALIHGKYGMIFPKDAVRQFNAYFFDIRIMTRKSWKAYLELLPPEHKLLLYKALVGREVELRAELDFPNKISVSEHYQKLHIYAMEKFDTYRSSSEPNADQHAIKWAQIAMSSGDKYEKLKTGDTTDFSKELQMEFDFVDIDFPTIGEESLEELRDATSNNDEDGEENDDN